MKPKTKTPKQDSFCLSNEIKDYKFSMYPHGISEGRVIDIEDVKEFIRRIKEELKQNFWHRKIDEKRSAYWISAIINQNAGEDLI